MKNRWHVRRVLVGLLVALLVVPACGKKGDPIPPRLKAKPEQQRIADLTVASIPEGILLRWSLPGADVRTEGFRILRSETPASEACPGCPQDYRILVVLKTGDALLVREGASQFRYTDIAVKEGHFYSYQVSVCDSQGQCGGVSKPAQLIREKR